MKVARSAGRDCAQAKNLEQVKQGFARWRESRKRGEHFPEPLGTAAMKLAREYGVERIARELRIDYARLKRRVDGGSGRVRKAVGEARFVELLAPKAVGIGECVVELENARGAKMRIQVNGGDMAGSLASLSSAFWRAS